VGGREAGERHGEEEDGELHAEEGCGVCVGGGRGGTSVGGRKRVGQGGNSGKENGAHYTGAEHLTFTGMSVCTPRNYLSIPASECAMRMRGENKREPLRSPPLV
jgi:hypothetical protein